METSADPYDWEQCIDSPSISALESELYDLADRHCKVPGWLSLSESVDFALDCLNSFSVVKNIDTKDLERLIKVLTHSSHCHDSDPAICRATSQISVKYKENKEKGMDFESAAIKAKAEWLGQEILRLLNPGENDGK